MKIVLQRVSKASVFIDNSEISKIDEGLLIFWGVEKGDSEKDALALSRKISNLRIFSDEEGKMNLSILDVGGEILVVSQFTLNANVVKGNRPSFINSEDPEVANEIINLAIEDFKQRGIKVQSGEFGSLMDIKLTNHGPVTLTLNSKDSVIS
tara:strand:- start:1061 stop:1516 length:456 start_codon:yes stop_codon:yes gene_type:complete